MEYPSDFFFTSDLSNMHIRSRDVIKSHTCFLVITFDWNKIQASNQLQRVCHRDESTDMQHDLIGLGHDLDLRSNLEMTF